MHADLLFIICRLILRISGELSGKTVDPNAKLSDVNAKFGKSVAAAKTLLLKAKEHGANVVGIS